MRLFILTRSGDQLVFVVLIDVGKVVRYGLLWATFAYRTFLTAVSGRARTELLLRARHFRALLLSNRKHWRRLFEVDSLTVHARTWLHFLLTSAAKYRTLTLANLKLGAALVLAI